MTAPAVAPDWRDRAACLDDADVFTGPQDGYDVTDAKAICRSCPVLAACLASIDVVPGYGPDGIVQAGRFWVKGRVSDRFPMPRRAS